MSENKDQKKEPTNLGGNNNSTPKIPKFNGYWIYGILLLLFISFFLMNQNEAVKTLPYSKFTQRILPSGDIELLTVIKNLDQVEVTLKKDAIKKYEQDFGDSYEAIIERGPHFKIEIPSVEKFYDDLKTVEEQKGFTIPNTFEQRSNYLSDIINFLWPLILLLIIWIIVFRRMGAQGGGGGAGNIC